MQPLVSVITPTYNRAAVIKNAIGSVQNQTYSNWELIVVDDGSTDGTSAVVASYGDDRIRYVVQKNQGAASARNYGLEESRGEWIMYLDSDDILLPNCIERMCTFIAAAPKTVFAFPNNYRFLELHVDGELVEQVDQSRDSGVAVTARGIAHRNVKVDFNAFTHHRRVVTDGLRFDESMRRMEDWDFMLQLCEAYPNGLLHVPEILYTYAQKFGGDGVVSAADYQGWADAFEYIYQKHKDDLAMQGQSWYPEKVAKWENLARRFEKEEVPPYYLYYFKNHWPEQYERN